MCIRDSDNISQATVTKTGERTQEKRRGTERRERNIYERRHSGPTSHTNFPKPYDKVVSAVKGGGNNTTQRGTMEANNKPATSMQ